jgi:RNA polymerase sigma factor (sigma-70 family)
MALLHLHRLPGCDLPGVPDAELVARFVADRDEAAFELLAYRHGPMVWATCRRVLSNHHAAEDAFQATFLVLARKAAAIRRTTSVAAWLHRVAVRAGLDLRRRKPLASEPLAAEPIDSRHGPVARAEAAELGRDFDAAVNDLPARLRYAFILCDLQGHTLAAAATILHCPQGTVESRLTRARQRLRKRFAAYALGGFVAARVPATVHAGVLRGVFGRGSVAPAVAALAKRAGSPAFGFALPGAAAVVAAGLLVAAFGLADPPKPDPKPAQVETPKAKDEALPAGAIARLGSDRFRHDSSVGPPAFSPDGRRLAVADRHGVHIFDTATGRQRQLIPLGEKHTPRVVRFVADGKRLALGSGDWNKAAHVTVFNLADGKAVARADFRGTNQIFVADVSADGDRVLVDDRGKKIFLWDMTARREVWTIDDPQTSHTLPFTTDGKAFVTTDFPWAELREAATGRLIATVRSSGKPFQSMHAGAAGSPTGRLAVTSDDESRIAILDPRRPGDPVTFNAARRTERLHWSPDEKHLIGFGQDETWVFDTTAPPDKAVIARLPAASLAAFSPDSKTLALVGFGFVTLYDTATWKPLPQSADPSSVVRAARFTADGTAVIGYTRQGWVRWPLDGGPGVRLSDDAVTHREGCTDVSVDGRFAVDVLYTAGSAREQDKYSLRVTDLASGKTRVIPMGGTPWRWIRISPDGQHVSAMLDGREYVVWDVATGAVLHRTVWKITDDRFLVEAQPASDGRSFVRSMTSVYRAGAQPGEASYEAVYVTDHRTKAEFKIDPVPWSIFPGGTHFSGSGSRVALRGGYGDPAGKTRLSVFDTAAGRRLCEVSLVSGYLISMPFSADERCVVMGGNEGELIVAEIASGQPRAAFRHAGVVLSAAFHPDGTKLVACSPEAPVYVWDLIGKPGPWDATRADAVWADLASADAKVAFAAIRLLRANPAAAVEFLRGRVKVEAVPADATVADLIKQLDAKEFAARERAEKALIAVADLLKPRLEAERQRTTSAEVRERLDRVLKSTDDMTGDRLRAIRVCEVLEGIGGPEAVKVLKVWAAGPAAARLTVEAAESVRRMGR